MHFLLKFAYSVLASQIVLLLAGCHSKFAHLQDAPLSEQYPTAREKTDWIKKRQLSKATAADLRLASSTEQAFRDGQAQSSDGLLAVSFTMGDQVPLGHSKFSSTSFYTVIDRETGKELLRIPSTVTKQTHVESNFPYEQKIWFLSGGRILLQESWADGCAPHDMLALLAPRSDSDPKIRYLALPEFDDHSPVKERGSYPYGIAGEWIIFNPLISDQPFKRKLSDIPEASPPLPFDIG